MIYTQSDKNSHAIRLETILSYSILYAIIFLPDIKLSSSFAARPEDILVLIAFIYIALGKAVFDTFYMRMIALMAIIMFASIGINDRLLSLNSFEFYNKIVKGSVCYMVTLYYLQDNKHYQLFQNRLWWCIFFVAILNVLQIVKIPGLSNLYGIYSNQIQMDAFDKVSSASALPRITGLIGNPNNNATFFLILIGFSLDQLFMNKRAKILNWLLVILCIVIIMLTQSRTMFAATGGLFVLMLCFTGNIMIILLAAGFYFIIQVLDIKYLALLFNRDELAQTNSYTGRLSEWQALFKMIKLQPLIGFGGYKEYFYETQTYPENEYVLGWFRYGVFYLIAYSYWFIHLFINGLMNVWNKLSNGYFMISLSMAMIIGSISNTPFNNPRLFVLFSIICAYLQAGQLHGDEEN